MSDRVLVLAPMAHPEASRRAALASSRWVAEQASESLRRVGARVTIADPPVTRASLEVRLERSVGSSGVAFFGHGSTEAVFGDDGQPLLDAANCDRLDGAWFYAFACRAGVELVGNAAGSCVASAGYEAAVIVDFEPEELSGALREAFAEFVSTVPVLFARGVFDRASLVRELEARAETVARLIYAIDEPPSGIEIALQQLIARLVVQPA